MSSTDASVDGDDISGQHEADTPIDRAAINQMKTDELDDMLARLRDNRLERVRQLEAIAQVKADEAQLVVYMKFERAYKRAHNALVKLAEQEEKVEALIHKARVLAIECNQ